MWWMVFMLLVLVPFAIAGLSLAPWVPTSKKDIERLQEILEYTPGEKFLEFGCGDGRVSHAIAQQNPDLEVVGIELALPVFVLAKIRQLFSPLPNLSLQLGSAFSQNFQDYDIIYIFGMPESLQKKVLPKFEKEAKKGTRFISYVFSLKEYQKKVKTYGTGEEKSIHVLIK